VWELSQYYIRLVFGPIIIRKGKHLPSTEMTGARHKLLRSPQMRIVSVLRQAHISPSVEYDGSKDKSD
jgi:hypothetical protein